MTIKIYRVIASENVLKQIKSEIKANGKNSHYAKSMKKLLETSYLSPYSAENLANELGIGRSIFMYGNMGLSIKEVQK